MTLESQIPVSRKVVYPAATVIKTSSTPPGEVLSNMCFVAMVLACLGVFLWAGVRSYAAVPPAASTDMPPSTRTVWKVE